MEEGKAKDWKGKENSKRKWKEMCQCPEAIELSKRLI